MKIIETEDITYRFPDGTIGIDKISLTFQKGEFIIIAGPNGSGKTTLLRHFNGLILPDTGEVRIKDKPVSKDIVRARKIVGMMFQDADSQIVGETVYDDVAFGPENLQIKRSEIKKRVEHALKATGLTDLSDQRPHVLSGGEKRRLAIAAVLAMEPEILVFDEPFISLDYPGTIEILKYILSLHRDGHTIIIATHELEKVIAHADRLIIMKDGNVVRNGPPQIIVKEAEEFGIREPCLSRAGMEIKSWLC